MLPKRVVCALCCGALILTASVRAEETPVTGVASPEVEALLRVGARVRVNQGAPKLKAVRGRVLSIDDQHLLLEVRPGKDPLALRLADIRTLDVVVGRKRATKKGAIIGGAVLVIPAALLGLVAGGMSQWECNPCDDSAPMKGAVAGAAIGAGLGVSVGALIGSAIEHDDWRAVEPRRLSATLVPTRHGVGASVSFRF